MKFSEFLDQAVENYEMVQAAPQLPATPEDVKIARINAISGIAITAIMFGSMVGLFYVMSRDSSNNKESQPKSQEPTQKLS